MKTYNISQLSALQHVVSDLSQKIQHGTIYLHGDLGAGKTTFVQTWIHGYDSELLVTSPTYNLVNEYKIGDKSFIHSDLYRLTSPDELLFIGVEDWNSDKAIIFIEWPDKGKDYLPAADYTIHFLIEGKQRFLSINQQ